MGDAGLTNQPGETSYLPQKSQTNPLLPGDNHQHERDQDYNCSIQPRKSHKLAKTLSLLCSSIAALASGTPYLYGVYSPQLISRCGFSALDSSYLSFSGSIGTSIGGFIAGLIIDKFGVKPGLLLGAALEFIGFGIFYINYKYALHNFFHLLIAMCCIGFGSVLAYFATIKVATLNFPKHRGFANACPVSAFGLAALFYAFVSTVFFADNIEGLLKFIALFTGLVISASSIFIRIYENEEDDDERDEEEGDHTNGNGSECECESSDETELETGLKYLLKGHRGSFAEANNIFRSDSSASLFTDFSDASSSVSSSASSLLRDPSRSSLSNLIISPISITNSQSGIIRSNSNGAFSNVSTSPADFKTRQSVMRSASFGLGTPLNNSPRASHLFGSVTQKQPKLRTNDESAALDSMGSMTNTATSTTSLVTASLSSTPTSHVRTLSRGKLTPVSKSDMKQLFTDANTETPIEYSSIQIPADTVVGTNTTSLNEPIDGNALAELRKRSQKKSRRKKKNLSLKEHFLELLKNKLFLSHYVLNAFYCAIGQVYIFSIGFIVRAQVNYYQTHNPSSLTMKLALYISESSHSSNGDIAVAYQALQVSIISFSNFLGRLISGPASDLIHKKLKLDKILVVIASLLVLTAGQISLLEINKLDFLSLTSFLIGLSYGSIYGTMPSIVADSFGSRNFATTWALLGTAPISVFLMLSDYFGSVYDENSEWIHLGDEKTRLCMQGRGCYQNVFQLTSVICLLLLTGYIWLMVSCRQKQQ
jgi:MFS family permease